MAKRTNLQIVCDTLRDLPLQQATPARLAGELGWTVEKVNRVVDEAEGSGVPLFRERRVLKFRGTERVGEVGIYHDAARILETRPR